jgi:hypothetical protein
VVIAQRLEAVPMVIVTFVAVLGVPALVART